jgi:hypothetical protein
MDSDETYIGRKRTVLIEKISYGHKISKDGMLRRFGLPLFFNMDFLRKNRFVVEMQIDDNIIKNDNVQGFSISHINDSEKIIKINTAIHVDDWISDYEKVNIIKVYLLDGLGNEHREFDFDVVYKGYSFDCDYRDDALVVPHFIYRIIE